MTKTAVNVIVSLFFLLITAGGFGWLWMNSKNSVTTTSAASSYPTIEIDSVKKQATELLGSLEKNSDIPLSAPTSKMGRVNPFLKY